MLLVLAWAVLSRVVGAPIILPGPILTLASLWDVMREPGFALHVIATAGRAVAGFVIACVVGGIWGILAGSNPRFDRIARPALTLVRSTPVIAVILLALIWFRANTAPVFVTVLMVLPIVVENVAQGTRNASGELLEMARVFRLSRRLRTRVLILPSIRPFAFAAVHSGLGMAYKVTVAAEVIVQPHWSLGGSMQEARFYLDTPRILALTFIVIVVSALSELVVRSIERAIPAPRLKKRGSWAAAGPGADTTGRTPATGVSVDRVSKEFAGRCVLSDLTLTLAPGIVTVLLGPSGCGKTTLLRIISALTEADGGAVDAGGHVSIVFQEPRLLPWVDVRTNVDLVLPAGLRDETESWFDAVGLSDRTRAFPGALSGGMQQRVALIRALAAPAETLLLDEPLQNLDLAVKLDLAALIREVTGDRSPVTVMVTHDLVEALATADRIVMLARDPMSVIGELVVDDASVRDPRSGAHQRMARRIYDVLLSSRNAR